MEFHPVFLRVSGRPCVVVGAGRAAEPRILALVEAGATVTVIAPTVSVAVARLAADGRLRHLPRSYRRGDLHGFRLAYAATEDDTVHAAIAAEADASGVLLNVVDRPAWCDFITPAVVRQGALTVAISTGGASPALARKLRADLEERFGPEYAVALELLRRLRPVLRARGLGFAAKQEALGRLVDSPLLEYVRDGRRAEIDRLLAAFGMDLSLATLGMEELGGPHE